MKICRWLLNHSPGQRPTAKELLLSDQIPVQEAELSGVLQAAIAKPASRMHKKLLDALFTQPIKETKCFIYDQEMHKVCTNHNEVLDVFIAAMS